MGPKRMSMGEWEEWISDERGLLDSDEQLCTQADGRRMRTARSSLELDCPYVVLEFGSDKREDDTSKIKQKGWSEWILDEEDRLRRRRLRLWGWLKVMMVGTENWDVKKYGAMRPELSEDDVRCLTSLVDANNDTFTRILYVTHSPLEVIPTFSNASASDIRPPLPTPGAFNS
ncbi:hypothetical protein BDN70DRAFT_923286, partial [Pholiota conissans]